jgi:diguanylate cyclase (GGDEF)-like protein
VLLASQTVRGSDLVIENLNEPISLAGAWRFQPGDDMAWADPGFNDRSWPSLMVPRDWNRQGFDDYSGMGWYRINLLFDRSNPEVELQLDQLAVLLGKVHSAYEIYVGGQRLGGLGKLPPDPEMLYDRYMTYSIPFSAIGEDGKVTVALRVWAQDLVPGGTAAGAYEGPFRVGTLSNLGRDMGHQQVISLAMTLIYAMFGLYHLYLYQRNPQFRQYLWFGLLWFGLLSVAVGAYTLLISQWTYVLPLSFLWLKKLEFATLYVTPALFMSMLWALLEDSPRGWIRWYQRSFYAAGALALVVPGFWILFKTLHLWHLMVIPVILGLAYRVIYHAHRGNTEARTILLGMLVFTAASFNDLAVDHGYIHGPRIMSMGFAAVLVSMALSMANNITRLFNNLEAEVEERTRELSELNARLDEAASVDSLTRILNRRGFSQKVEQEIARVGRTRRGFVLIMADIDYFKDFNDQYGHACGDYVLERVAGYLSKQLRDMDILARWGGEEFILLLPETTLEGGEVAAEKLRYLLEQHPFQYMGHTLSLTMTFGVAQYRHGNTLDECLLRADKALYQGKKLGRNRVEGEVDDRQIDLLTG